MRDEDSAGRYDAVRAEALRVLRQNSGFVDPESWVDYAIAHGFRRVASARVLACPDCGSDPRAHIGQFVHYSTLMKLAECAQCGLVWADARIDAHVVRRHFESTYKDEMYFESGRRAVFEQLAAVVSRLAAPGSNVLDIGGAKGHLMQRVARRRPDCRITVHDISEEATKVASERYKFATVCGDMNALARHEKRYGVVVLSDVAYYEPDVRALWSVLSRLVEPQGSVVIRVPNKLPYIKTRQKLYDISRSGDERARQTVVAGFNPEHVTIMHRRYLTNRLRSLGFRTIEVMPSRLTCSSLAARGAEAAFWRLARAVGLASRARLIFAPAMIVVGRDRGRGR